ncbi:MAG: hypothetical protein M1830_001558 [Pleopsidium flavum]|nr:MAG: hypothetical protein M1830_001558 [Pleopsidium flavum]
MPADKDKRFYDLLDSVAATTGDEDAIAQNKHIKEAEFAEDSREPTAEEEEELKRFVEQTRHGEGVKVRKDAGSVIGQGHGDGSCGKGYDIWGMLSQGGDFDASRVEAEVHAARPRKGDDITEDTVQKEHGGRDGT